MEKQQVVSLIESILTDRGVPQRVKLTLEDSLTLLDGNNPEQEKLSQLISVLDDASSNPNLSMNARTQIWSIVSTLEGEISRL